MNKKKIIVIHSKVSYGFVGLNTTALVLQLKGYEVITIPTVLYSNHLGYTTVGGGIVPDDLFTDILSGILKLDILDDVAAIVSGYIGSGNQVRIISDFIRQIKIYNPSILYLCDPVMGDIDKGLYVDPCVSSSIVKNLLPLSDISTPNQFEIQKIVDSVFSTVDETLSLIRKRYAVTKQKIIITGARFKTTLEGTLDNCVIENGFLNIIRNKAVDIHPPGTGELFAAHLLSFLLKGMNLNQAVLLSGDILSSILFEMFNSGRKEFEAQDIIASINILQPSEIRENECI